MVHPFQKTLPECLNLANSHNKRFKVDSNGIGIVEKSATNVTQRSRKLGRTGHDNQIDWGTIAPEVALRLKGEPKSKSHTEWRWGNKGKFRFLPG